MPRRTLRRLVAALLLLLLLMPSSSPEEPVDDECPLPRRRLSLLSTEGRFKDEEDDDDEEALFMPSMDRAKLDAIGSTCGDGSPSAPSTSSLVSTRRPPFSLLLLLRPWFSSPSMLPMLVLRPCGVGTCTHAFKPQSMCASQQNEKRPEAAPSKSTT